MTLLTYALLLQLAAVPAAPALPMPPPPAGMHTLSGTDARALPMPAPPEGMHPLAPAEAEQKLIAQSDEPEDEDAAAASDEMAQMHAAEEAVIEPSSENAPPLSASALGIASPVRMRLEDGLEDWSLREDRSPLDLAPVTDLAHFDVSQVADEYDIPVEMQPLVAQYIRFFQGPGRVWFRHWMERSRRYIPVMKPILEKAGLPGDTVYLAMIESGFSTDAKSWASAVGPWQFIAATGKHYGLEENFWVDERRDPIKATKAAAKYLGQLHQELGDWYLAWAAYNTGGGRIRRQIRKKGTRDFWEISEGRGLALETKHYVPKLIACALVAKHPEAFGFDTSEFRWQQPMVFDEVKLVDPVDLAAIARAAGTSVKELKSLNPGLKRWCTPPATREHPYTLRLPRGTAPLFAENFAKLPKRQRLTFRIHRVKSGDTLSAIALAYGTKTEAIMSMNHLKSARRLRLHSDLVIPVPRQGPAPEVVVAKTSPGDARPEVSKVVLAKALAQARAAKPVPAHLVAAPPRGKLHASGEVRTESVAGRTRLHYAVREGDTLWSISQRFGCSVQDLRKWNHLGRRSTLQVGRSLVLWPKAHVVSSRKAQHPWVAQQ